MKRVKTLQSWLDTEIPLPNWLMQSKRVVIASGISATVFVVLLVAGAALHVVGPIQLGQKLWVTSGHQHWLVFFDGVSIKHKKEPFFGGTIAINDGDDIILANGVRTKSITDKSWHLGWKKWGRF